MISLFFYFFGILLHFYDNQLEIYVISKNSQKIFFSKPPKYEKFYFNSIKFQRLRGLFDRLLYNR